MGPVMTDWDKIVYTSIFTIIGGTIIFVVGQLMLKLFIEPICRQHQVLGEIDHTFKHYKNLYGNIPPDFKMQAAKDFRRLALDVRTNAYSIRCYKMWSNVNVVLSKNTANNLSDELIQLSNDLERDYYNTVERYEKKVHILLVKN